jgi:hypothetical protein
MTMTWDEYVELSARTDKPLPERERKLHHALLLTTEYLEWIQTKRGTDNDTEERGDMLWALAAIYRDYNVKDTAPDKRLANCYRYDTRIERLASAIKANIVYSKDNVNEIAAYTIALRLSLWRVRFGEANIAKLKARYPDKYDDSCATNRDTGKEMEAIRGTIKT